MNVRIAKFIADSGATSRRGAEQLIESGAVTVNGKVITSPIFFVDGTEKIAVSGKIIKKDTNTVVYAFHKPINTMTTTHDPDGRRTIYDVLPQQYHKLKYVGRLDFKTTGLLLLTNDGALARKLTLPSSGILRTYIASVSGSDFSGLAQARQGITVDGIHYRPMKIKILPDNQLHITVSEGKKNEIRIVLAACGLPVRHLHRLSYGMVELGNLSPGKIKSVSQKTIDVMLKSF